MHLLLYSYGVVVVFYGEENKMYYCDKCHTIYHYTRFNSEPVTKCNCVLYEIELDGEDYEQYAISPYDAAMKFAEDYNVEGEYCLMNEEELIVVKSPDGTETEFNISAEPDVHYSATEIKL